MAPDINFYDPNMPLSPFCVFILNGRKYEYDPPNFLLQASIKRSYDRIGFYDITISDCNDFELESYLTKAILNPESNPIAFQIGWSEGDRSPMYQGLVWEYVPQFLSNMNMNFQFSGMVDDTFGIERSLSYRYKSYDELVQKVCATEGWSIGRLVKCEEHEEKLVTQTNQTSIDFLRKHLPDARSEYGGHIIKLLHTCTSSGGSVLYMVEIDTTKPKIIKNEYNFVVNGGPYGNVISFTPQYDGSATAYLGVETSYSKLNANEMVLSNAKNTNYVSQSSAVNTRVLTSGAIRPSDMTANLNNLWFSNRIGAAGYDATLEIIGDPNILPFDYINVLPIRPDGKLHHSAGTYMVLDITDNVLKGSFTTTLNLLKIPGIQAPLTSVLGGSPTSAPVTPRSGSVNNSQPQATQSTSRPKTNNQNSNLNQYNN